MLGAWRKFCSRRLEDDAAWTRVCYQSTWISSRGGGGRRRWDLQTLSFEETASSRFLLAHECTCEQGWTVRQWPSCMDGWMGAYCLRRGSGQSLRKVVRGHSGADSSTASLGIWMRIMFLHSS